MALSKQVELKRDITYRQIELMWNDGYTLEQIRQHMKYTKGNLSQKMYRMRQAGRALPKRYNTNLSKEITDCIIENPGMNRPEIRKHINTSTEIWETLKKLENSNQIVNSNNKYYINVCCLEENNAN